MPVVDFEARYYAPLEMYWQPGDNQYFNHFWDSLGFGMWRSWFKTKEGSVVFLPKSWLII